jgi:sulfate permease, SulP family
MGDKPFLGLVAPFVPAADWIRAYKPTEFPRDLVAGLSLAAFVIPESLAYASLAQLPPVTGLYCYLVAGIAYAVFGTSRQLAVGPTSALAITVATSVFAMADGDLSRALALASALALMVGVVCIAGRFVGLANVAYFISDAILVGFKTGAALYIASTQLPKLFGIEGISGNVFERFGHVIVSLHETHVFSLVVGLAAIALFVTFGRIFPGRPTTLFVVVGAIAVMSAFGLAETGIKIVGEIPTGLPAINVPNVHLSDISALVPIALACVLLSYGETISVARSFAQKHGYDISPEQELTALGAANVATGLAQGFPVAGGMSQTAVNDMGVLSIFPAGDLGRNCSDAGNFYEILSQPARAGPGSRRADGSIAHGAIGRSPPVALFISCRVSHLAGRTLWRTIFRIAERPAVGRGRVADHAHRERIAPARRRPWA